MWLKCANCKKVWETAKLEDKAAYEIQPNNIQSKCPNCKTKNISWVLNPRYRKRSIGILKIIDGVALDKPYTSNISSDPRGPIKSDFRIFLTRRDDNKQIYYWLPYWITINNKKKFGQFSPIIREKDFTELIIKAISKRFFKRKSINLIRESIKSINKYNK